MRLTPSIRRPKNSCTTVACVYDQLGLDAGASMQSTHRQLAPLNLIVLTFKSVPKSRFCEMLRLWKWYQTCLQVYPVRMQIVSSGLIWGVGDIAAQTVTHLTTKRNLPLKVSVSCPGNALNSVIDAKRNHCLFCF